MVKSKIVSQCEGTTKDGNRCKNKVNICRGCKCAYHRSPIYRIWAHRGLGESFQIYFKDFLGRPTQVSCPINKENQSIFLNRFENEPVLLQWMNDQIERWDEGYPVHYITKRRHKK